MKPETEIWQVSTPEGVFQADLATLKQWVAEGAVLPTDRVRKGSLNWIDAGRAPVLRRVFSGEERVEVPAQTAPQTQAAAPDAHDAAPATTPDAPDLGLAGDDAAEGDYHTPTAGDAALPGAHPLGYQCHFHTQAAATHVCRMCSATLCRSCPNRVGTSNVLLCPVCGGFCDPLDKLTERLALYARQGEGFGLADFRRALAYPFSHLVSLLGGALLYGFLLMVGMRGRLLALALVFGCISLVVRRVGRGRLERDFLPDFSEFNVWDDLVVPCALGVGVTVVTLGPLILLFCALFFGWLGGPQSPSPLGLQTQAAYEQAQREAERRVVTPDDMDTLVKGGTAEQEAELEKKVNAMRPGAQMARTLEQTKEDDSAYGFLVFFVRRPGLALVLGLLALLWAAFYHPMALLVAGWTESLKSVMNPLVGLDTMRHMGAVYFKAFLMYLAVQAVSFLLTFLVGLVTAPFDMPLVGNLPGTFLSGVVTFYTSLVIACLLGLALFKSADRLGIEID